MNETARSKASYAIFDMDGLLLDTESIYTKATQKIVARFGKTFDWSIKANMIGRASMESARYLVDVMDLPITPEDYLQERDVWLREHFPACTKLPGAEDLIHRLHNAGVPIAVATSSGRELFEVKTSNHQSMFKLFDTVVTADDPEVSQGKPAPDIFLTAAKRLQAHATESLVFEDAPAGLAAGIAAGMRVVVVPDPNMDKGRYAEAEMILNSLEEFDPVAFGLVENYA